MKNLPYILLFLFTFIGIAYIVNDVTKKQTFSYGDTTNSERLFKKKDSVNLNSSSDYRDSRFIKDSIKKQDSLTIKKLSSFFRKEKDEFKNGGLEWWKPVSAPYYTNANGTYCYFAVENKKAKGLRFRLQYYADEWLFIRSIIFNVDGVNYDYVPNDMETDNGDGGYIWEWFDERVTENDVELIKALGNAKNVKMKLNGSQYYQIRYLNKTQIAAIKQAYELYLAMGGYFY